ncbi:MAG: Do family serine endopeptidase [Myxococcales bacterium]|nr:Do family serine endopeptidase [Myxococcales bacterium]
MSNPLRSLRVLLIAVAVGALLLSSGVVQIDLAVGSEAANSIDLFGKGEAKTADKEAPDSGAFWKDGQGEARYSPPGNAPASFATLAEKTSPAVVNIQTSKKLVARRRGGDRNRPRHPLEEFFGGPGGPFPDMFGGERNVPSLGTGFVISEDGYIVTNNHVVEDVDKIEVLFFGGEQTLEAQVVGRDPKTDVALIKVETDEPLPSLPLGNSDKVNPGDWVVAIGNPFGLGHTVTAGIVSAKSRVINPDPEARRFDDFIQTDAAINPGNSGGPLINLAGEVIGINTAINPRANTIGFAVPVNIAKDILPQLRTAGRVSRGWLGVYIQEIDDTTAELMELDQKTGALVSKVEPGGPADEAGIRRGDVIVSFNGEPIDEMSTLPRVVARTPVGSGVDVKVIRKGKTKSLNVELGELDRDEEVVLASAEGKEGGAFGVIVKDLDARTAEQLGLDEPEGVLITEIEPDSPASEAGLRRGDVILEVNQKQVSDARGFEKAVRGADKGALLLVRRGEAEVFVAVKRES